jgi:hypothetical protein
MSTSCWKSVKICVIRVIRVIRVLKIASHSEGITYKKVRSCELERFICGLSLIIWFVLP